MKKNGLKNTVLSAMFLGLALVLPFLTGQIKQFGSMLLPMHIPVLLCGLVCGPFYGLVTGFIAPLLRSFLFSMPRLYPDAVAMAFELAAYGFVAGFLYSRSKWKCIKALYRCLIPAMILGRIVWGVAQVILLGFGGFTFTAFISGAVLTAIPGILTQLIIIPAVMVALNRARLVPLFKKRKKNVSE